MENHRKADEIRQAMAQLRSDADRNADAVRLRATAMTDWRYYVRRYPKLSLAAAAAVGYLLVPSKTGPEVRQRAASAAPAKEASLGGWEPMVASAARMAFKAAVPFVSQELARWWQHRANATISRPPAEDRNEY